MPRKQRSVANIEQCHVAAALGMEMRRVVRLNVQPEYAFQQAIRCGTRWESSPGTEVRYGLARPMRVLSDLLAAGIA